jgi:aminoglycoside phosphotransferase (APT) family kinase protein
MAERKMHADEVDIDLELVRRLVADQFPDWAKLPVEPVLPWGTDNALYRLGEDMVVRLPRTERTNGTLKREREWLPRLSPHLPLEVPSPLAEGRAALGYPFEWSIYRWLEGEPVTDRPLADLGQAVADLSGFVSALERLDASDGPGPDEYNAFRGVPLIARDEPVRKAIASLASSIDVESVTGTWEEALHTPEWDSEPVWLHGDLDGRNLLVMDGRLSGVLDWGCLSVGDPACDVMVAWKMFSGDAREAFREALEVDKVTWARSRGWALSQALIALGYYTMETNAALVLEAERWLAEVLADYSSAA